MEGAWDWEGPLIAKALEGLSEAGVTRRPRIHQERLAIAYRRCETIICQHSRSFYWASALLPSEKRRAIRALYAFCRIADDCVDKPEGDPVEALARWRCMALTEEPPSEEPVLMAWADVRDRYRIPRRWIEQLLDALSHDLGPRRYQTFLELSEYCYGVAATVGLMSMQIIGFTGPEAVPYAVRLGVALQLTNILRDVGEDWHMGRIYLPLEELHAFGLREADLETGQVDARWRAFMRFQIARVRRLYRAAWPGLAYLSREGQGAVAAALVLYSGILEAIERNDYDVFRRRAALPRIQSLVRLLETWWRSRISPLQPLGAAETDHGWGGSF